LVRGNRNADGTYSPTSRWENGIAYEITTDGLYAQTHDACDYTADGGVEIGNAPGSPGSANTVYSADYAPFVIEATDGCRTSMGYTPEERKSRAADALELMTQKAVEREFWNNGWTGVNSATNRSLVTAADTVTLLGGTPQKPRRAIAALEQALADHGAGTLGSVHVTRDALSMLKLDVGNDPNSDTMYTPGGNLLIGGVGYPGTGPNGEARTTGNVWAYACGPVQVRLSPVKVSDEPSKITGPAGVESFSTNNTLVYTAERFAAVTFNGTRVYAVLMNLDG
jgi:hypothetical protein